MSGPGSSRGYPGILGTALGQAGPKDSRKTWRKRWRRSAACPALELKQHGRFSSNLPYSIHDGSHAAVMTRVCPVRTELLATFRLHPLLQFLQRSLERRQAFPQALLRLLWASVMAHPLPLVATCVRQRKMSCSCHTINLFMLLSYTGYGARRHASGQ